MSNSMPLFVLPSPPCRLQHCVSMPGCTGDNSIPESWIKELQRANQTSNVPLMDRLFLYWPWSRTLWLSVTVWRTFSASENPPGSSVLWQKWKEIWFFVFCWSAFLISKTNSSVVKWKKEADCFYFCPSPTEHFIIIAVKYVLWLFLMYYFISQISYYSLNCFC